MKICMITCLLGDQYKSEVEFGTLSKQIYCDTHGYDFIIGDEQDYQKITHKNKKFGWLKVYKLLENIFHYDYIFLSDADVCMMNLNIKLESIIDKYFKNETLMLITKDHNDYNSGNIIIKGRDGKMLGFIHQWLNLLDHDFPQYVGYQEQPSLLHMIHESDFAKYINVLNQNILNSYSDDTIHKNSTQYKEGDFLIHYAGYDVYNIPMKEKMNIDFNKFLHLNNLSHLSSDGRAPHL